jgi:FMN-dependent NADH-azoreductase
MFRPCSFAKRDDSDLKEEHPFSSSASQSRLVEMSAYCEYACKQQQAEIHEDDLFNFPVKPIDEEVLLDIANDAEIDAKDTYEILVGATVNGCLNLDAMRLQ